MPYVETRWSENKKESEQRNETKKWSISCSHTVPWWVILPQFANWLTYFQLFLNQIDRFLISSVLKPQGVLMLSHHCNMIKALIYVCVALRQWIMISPTKQFTDLQILSIMKLEKLGTDVYFTNSLNHWPQRHCDKKASTETLQKQSVTARNVTIVSGQLMCRWRHNRSTFWNHQEQWWDKMLIYVTQGTWTT